MDIVNEILARTEEESANYKPITVEKPLELNFDLGTLLALDTNDVDKDCLNTDKEAYLQSLTRDATQLLLNKVWELPMTRVDEAICVALPPSKFRLPRAKPIPKPRPLTKWEQFAKEKGIQKTKKAKLNWDDQLQKWVPKFGYKRAAAQKEADWLLEVPQNADPTEDPFAKKREEKSEKVAKNELQRLRNIAKARNVKVPRMGLASTAKQSSSELSTALTVAKASTASLGRFQQKLPREKEAKGVATITPGVNRKRKPPPVSGKQEKKESMQILDTVLNKRPKIDIDVAVSKHLGQDLSRPSEGKRGKGKTPKKNPAARGRKASKQSKGARRPSAGKGKRAGGKAVGGRKRR